MKKDFKQYLRKLRKRGWRVDDTRNHIHIYHDDLAIGPIVLPRTPSDHRGLKNLRAEVRRQVRTAKAERERVG